jgi:hypothetical protein
LTNPLARSNLKSDYKEQRKTMKLSTVAEAISAELEEPILAIRGTLKKLYNQMSGEGQYGPWTIQSGMLVDKTGEIKILITNAPSLGPKYRGQEVEFRCTKGAKGGWTGIKRGIDKKDKKDNLTISDKAEVILMGEELEPEPGEPPPPFNGHVAASGSPQGAPPPDLKGTTAKPPPEQPQSPPASKGKSVAEYMAEGIGRLTQIANTQYAAASIVHEYLVPLLKERGIQLDPVATAALVQNMLIQCYYEKIHWNFPQKQFPIRKADATPPGDGAQKP